MLGYGDYGQLGDKPNRRHVSVNGRHRDKCVRRIHVVTCSVDEFVMNKAYINFANLHEDKQQHKEYIETSEQLDLFHVSSS